MLQRVSWRPGVRVCDWSICRACPPAQTTNLDGESNLKTRAAPAETKAFVNDRLMSAFHGVVKCGAPDEKLYKFDSQLRLGDGGGVISLSADQLLLQATHLRNTEFVYGVVVYTGSCARAECLRDF